MTDSLSPAVTAKVINGLYVEAMLLADEARAYFDLHSRESRNQMTPLQRVGFSCESLKVTTRLMHVVAWLLNQRALVQDASTSEIAASQQSLGAAPPSDDAAIAQLPRDARQIILASSELYDRVRRLEQQMAAPTPSSSPARYLQSRLLDAF
jgi:regulator of CtrA degradation